ncbi:MAG: kinase, partial [Candidatus Scalindua sp.]|nr:kinase [Candidatus Scalindua sp.]
KSIDEIMHPSVRETLKYLEIDYGVSIHHDGDIPARSGMGSSSAFTVGLLNTMRALEGKRITKEEITKEVIHIEQNLIKENVGSQDQTFAAYGGFNKIDFIQNGEILVEPIIIRNERLRKLEDSLMLFFTGFSRIASEVAGDKISNIPKNSNNLLQMKNMVDDAYRIITSENININEFGTLLNETWELKKKLSERVTRPEIDELYETAIKNGAIGGKLCGAGDGGFMVLYVEPKNQNKVRESLKNYLFVPFKFDFEGSKIIVYNPS